MLTGDDVESVWRRVAEILAIAVHEGGPGALSRPIGIRNLCADLLSDEPKVTHLLVTAAEFDVARRLDQQIALGMDPPSSVRAVAAALGEHSYLPDDARIRVVEHFAVALGYDVPASVEVAATDQPADDTADKGDNGDKGDNADNADNADAVSVPASTPPSNGAHDLPAWPTPPPDLDAPPPAAAQGAAPLIAPPAAAEAPAPPITPPAAAQGAAAPIAPPAAAEGPAAPIAPPAAAQGAAAPIVPPAGVTPAVPIAPAVPVAPHPAAGGRFAAGPPPVVVPDPGIAAPRIPEWNTPTPVVKRQWTQRRGPAPPVAEPHPTRPVRPGPGEFASSGRGPVPPPASRRSRARWVVAAALGVTLAIVAVIVVAVVGQRGGGSVTNRSTSGGRTGSTGSTASAGSTVASGTSSGFKVTPYASDFPVGNRAEGVGPTGVAFDQAGDLLVADVYDRNVYDVPSGGSAGPGRTINSAPYPPTLAPFGLAWSAAGHLYADYFADASGAIVEVDPRTGQILRTVVSLHTLAGGIAVDPASGDLLVAAPSQARVYRIGGLDSSSPSVSVYLSGANDVFDGIAVEPDRSGSAASSAGAGTLWAVDNRTGIVYGFAGTGAADPGQEVFSYTLDRHRAGTSPEPSGVVALGAQGQQQRVLVNENDGTIVMLSWTWGSASPTVTETAVTTGGTRGDFAVAGSDGCVYVTQSSAVEKVTLTNGSCDYYAGSHP